MKKIASFFILACFTVPLFAQLSPGIGVGGWARYVISPVGGKGTIGEEFTADNLYARNQSNQNWYFPSRGKVGMSAWGNSEYLGFNFDVAYIDGTIEAGDQAKLWVRPHDIIMFQFGKIEGNELRSGIQGGRLTFCEEENDIFTRFNPFMGMLVEFKPVNGLYIGASIDIPSKTGDPAKNVYDWEADRNAYQIGIGYKFDWGHLRVQLLANDGGVWTGKPIQAALSFTAIHNLTLELGGLYPLKDLFDNGVFSPAKGTLVAAYRIEQWDMMARATVVGYPYAKEFAGIRTKFAGVIKYTINFPLFVGAEIAYLSDYQENFYTQQNDSQPVLKDGVDLFQIVPFVGFKYGRGEFRIGLHWEQNFKGEEKKFKFEIPFMLELNFL